MVFKQIKKAQAAMEFLMTYSWAILAVLVVIGALVYFGVFDFENFFPDRCALGHPLQCVDHSLVDNNGDITFSFLISNQDQRSLNITNVSIISDVLSGTCYNDTARSLNTSLIAQGNDQVVNVNRAAGADSCSSSETITRNKNKYEITVQYHFAGNDDFKHQVKGEVLATVSKRGQ